MSTTLELCDCGKNYIRVEPDVISVKPGDILHAKVGILDFNDGQGPWIPSADELDYVRQQMQDHLMNVKGVVVEGIVTHLGVDLTIQDSSDTVEA